MSLKGYADISDRKEDDRIDVIGKTIMSNYHAHIDDAKPFQCAVCVDYDGTGDKGTRYLNKIMKRFPQVRHISRHVGPSAGVETLILGGPLQ